MRLRALPSCSRRCSAPWWLYTLINAYQHGEYSNKDDFPVRFASGVVAVPLLTLLAGWAVFLTGSREVNAWLNVAMAVTNVAFLIAILHPQRKEYKQINDEMEKAVLKMAANTNRRYISAVLGERFGSFYSVLSNLRIEYAIAYAKEHPNASAEDIAINSGFTTAKTYRTTLNNARGQKSYASDPCSHKI